MGLGGSEVGMRRIRGWDEEDPTMGEDGMKKNRGWDEDDQTC
jgi:hypothetical protein